MRPRALFCVSMALLIQIHHAAAETYKPDSVYVFKNDLLAVEAEGIKYSNKWQLETSHPGYTGKGYLKYVGPRLNNCIIWTKDNLGNPHPYGVDTSGACQAPLVDRLIIPAKITTPGSYSVNIRGWHTTPYGHCTKPESDYSIWVHMLDWPLPVRMSHLDTGVFVKFEWLENGPMYPDSKWGAMNNAFKINPKDTGIAVFYIAGKDQNFCADRVHIYRTLGANKFPEGCMDEKTPVSQKYPVGSVPSVSTAYRRGVYSRPFLRNGSAAQYDLTGKAVQKNRTGSLSASASPRGVFFSRSPLSKR